MADRNRGFDPLASLFEAPDPGAASLAEPEPAQPERSEAAAAPTSAANDAEGTEEPVDKAAIAKAVALAAAARLKDQKAAEASAPAEPSASDKAALARKLAQEAAARVAASAAPAPAPAAAPKPASRLDRIAKRAVRPRNALEAARLAAASEEAEREVAAAAVAAARKEKLSARVQTLIPEWLPGIGRVRVERAVVADQRDVLRPLWLAHRARFLKEGELERGVGAAAVLHALDSVASGQLVAAFVVTDASDYLVWMHINLDAETGRLLAAFADARSYFAAG